MATLVRRTFVSVGVLLVLLTSSVLECDAQFGGFTVDFDTYPLIVGEQNSVRCFITENQYITGSPLTLTLAGVVVAPSALYTLNVSANQHTYIARYGFTVADTMNNKTTTCTAKFPSSPATTVQRDINVYYPPSTPIISGPYSVLRGTSNTWTCVGKDADVIDWQFGNKTNINSNFSSTSLKSFQDSSGVERYNYTSTLTLPVEPGAQSFRLKCRVSHFAIQKEASSEISVIVTYPPVVSGSQNYTATATASQTLTCSVSATPAISSVTWYKDGVTVDTTLSRFFGATTVTPSLTISNIVKSDRGGYVCGATNAAGSTNGSTNYLLVRYSPEITYPQNPVGGVLRSDVTVNCVIDSYPAHTTVLWYRVDSLTNVPTSINLANQPNKYANGTASTPALTIKNLTNDDAGLYRCVADNDVGRGIGANVEVEVNYAPHVTVEKNKYDVDIGDNLTLPCDYDAFPAPSSVVWLKNSAPITLPSEEGRLTGGNITTPALTIRSLQISDSAIYECQVTSDLGMGSSSDIRVDVVYAPIVNVSQTSYTLRVGNNVTLACTANAYPQIYAITWYKGGLALNLEASPGKYSGSVSSSPSLNIYNLTKSDIGSYKCQATNQAGAVQSDVINLNVTYAPVMIVSATSYARNATESLTIPCSYDANPSPHSVQWTKNSQTIDVSSSGGKYTGSTLAIPSLTINQLASGDAGIYVCSSVNSIGPGYSDDITLTIYYSPEFNTTVTQYSKLKGETVTLECHASANPAPTAVLWYKDNAVLILTSHYGGGTLTTPDLTISNLTGADTATYFCVVTNSLGSTSSSNIDLDVQYTPEIVSDSTALSGTESSALTIPCTYDANPLPTQISWTKDNVSVDVSSVSYTGGTPGTPGLTIMSLVPADTGSYECTVTSARGSAQSGSIPVTVNYFPRVGTGSIDEFTANETQSVTIPCTINAVPAVTSVEWLRNDNVINISSVFKYSGGTLATHSLTILDLSSSDVGVYKCRATNDIGTSDSGNVTVHVNYKPEITVQPTQSATEPQSVTLSCSIDAVPALTSLRWYKDGQALDTSVAGRYSGATPSIPSLTILSVRSQDAGSYYCVATNSVGDTTSGTIVLTVEYFPVFTVAQTEVGGSVGQTVILSVSIAANPALTSLQWRKRDQSSNVYQDINVTSSNKYGGGSVGSPSLQINGLTSTDAGSYSVVATNSLGTRQSADIVVAVSFKPTTPSITGVLSNYNEGDTISITCSSNGFPQPSYRWYRGNTFLSNGTTLTISSAAPIDNAQFKCEAYNAQGASEASVTVDVRYKPRAKSTVSNVTATIGQTVNLNCATDANPDPDSYLWTHNGQVIGNTTSSLFTVRVSNSSMLGSYSCVATNNQGSSDPIVIFINQDTSGGGTTGGPNVGQSTEDSGLSTATLVLIIIICLIILIVLILVTIYFCTTRRCFKKDNDVGPTQPAQPPVVVPTKETLNQNGYYAAPMPPIPTSNGTTKRIQMDDEKMVPPAPANGRAPISHGVTISVPMAGTPRPHHLPPLGQDGEAQPAEPARDETPREKKKKHRKRRHRHGGEEGSSSHHHSPQHDPDV